MASVGLDPAPVAAAAAAISASSIMPADSARATRTCTCGSSCACCAAWAAAAACATAAATDAAFRLMLRWMIQRSSVQRSSTSVSPAWVGDGQRGQHRLLAGRAHSWVLGQQMAGKQASKSRLPAPGSSAADGKQAQAACLGSNDTSSMPNAHTAAAPTDADLLRPHEAHPAAGQAVVALAAGQKPLVLRGAERGQSRQAGGGGLSEGGVSEGRDVSRVPGR